MKYLLLLLLFAMAIPLAAQNSNDSGYVQKVQKRGKDATIKGMETYYRGKISIRQRAILEERKRLNEEIKFYLNRYFMEQK